MDDSGKIVAKYRGVTGYQAYAREFHRGDMFRAYAQVNYTLWQKEVQSLLWGSQFPGTVEEFEKIRGLLFDEKGNVVSRYQGSEGQQAYAADHSHKNALIAYAKVAAVLDSKDMEKLQWDKFPDSEIAQFQTLRARLVGGNAKVVPQYKGTKGQQRFARLYYKNDTKQAYQVVSMSLSPEQFSQLKWEERQLAIGANDKPRRRAIRATTAPNQTNEQTKARLFDEKGNLRAQYRGRTGYIDYADNHHRGSMRQAYKSVAVTLTEKEFEALSWGKSFPGYVRQFKEVKERLLDKNGNVSPKYKGLVGYATYANEHQQGGMATAYTLVTGALSQTQLQELGWTAPVFITSNQFLQLRKRIIDEKGQVNPTYKSKTGHALYAKRYTSEKMSTAYEKITAMLSIEELSALGWEKPFPKTVKELYQSRKVLLDDKGLLHSRYHHIKGYQLYAVKHFRGDMKAAYDTARSALSTEELEQLHWKTRFWGNVKEYKTTRSLLFTDNAKVNPRYQGLNGWHAYADDHVEGEIARSYQMVSTVLSKKEFETLNWNSNMGY